MSVLILEDNRQILNVLEELVMSVAEDEKVYATDNVGEAYKIAMETSIDVFLLDIILYTDKKGDTSGMQYAQSMRKLERYRFTPIIFITSLEDPEMYALRDLHAFGYIEKPFAPSQVKNLLRDALHFKTQKETDAMTEAGNHALHRDIHRLVDTLPILCYNAEKAIGGTEDEAALYDYRCRWRWRTGRRVFEQIRCGYHAYCTRKASCGPAGARLDACIRRK